MDFFMGTIPIDSYVSGGTITLFLGSHPPELKNDILHSDLYSKLVAQLKGNDRELSWSSYTSTLSKLQWTVRSREFFRSEFGTTSGAHVITKTLESSLSRPEQLALSKAFRELRDLPVGSPAKKAIFERLRLNIFFGNTDTPSTPYSTAFLFTVVRPDTSLLTVQVSFESNSALDMNIFTSPTLQPIADGKSNIRLINCYLSEKNYSQYRDSIIKKLGSKIETELLHVQASHDPQ